MSTIAWFWACGGLLSSARGHQLLGPSFLRNGSVLTLLRALNFVPQAHGSCVAFPLEYSIQGLSIHGSAMNDLGFSI